MFLKRHAAAGAVTTIEDFCVKGKTQTATGIAALKEERSRTGGIHAAILLEGELNSQAPG